MSGASGLLGRRLVERFVADGWFVTGLDRGPFPLLPYAPDEHHGIDLSAPHDLAPLLAGTDVLIHAAAIADLGRGYSEEDVLALNTATTARLLFAAVRAGVRRVVYISSQSVLGLSRGPDLVPPSYLPIDEAHPVRPRDGYALSKKLGEDLLALLCLRDGLTGIAIRLPVVWEADHFSEHVGKRIGDPQQAARSNWAYVDARDAAQGVALAAAVPAGGYQLFNIAAEHAFCERSLSELVAEYYGRLQCRIALDGSPSLFSAERAMEALGYRPRYRWSHSAILDSGKALTV